MLIVFCVLLFYSSINVWSQKLNEPILIYENSNSLIYNVSTENGLVRFISPIHSPGMTHGVISLDHLDHIQLDYMKMIMGSILLGITI